MQFFSASGNNWLHSVSDTFNWDCKQLSQQSNSLLDLTNGKVQNILAALDFLLQGDFIDRLLIKESYKV